jgi:peptide methionine sulfoxide reductase MsrB
MDDTLETLEKVISKKDIAAIQKIIIYQDSDGSYTAYGKYHIVKNSEGMYKVSIAGTHTFNYFYKLKNAAAWCSFDKRMLYKEANRLLHLDQMVFSMDTEIQIHSKLMKKSKNEEATLIYLAKLTNNKTKKRSFTNEINDFIHEYQRWQTKMFDAKPSY